MTSQPVPSTPTKIRLCRTDEISEGSVIKVEHGDLVLAVYNVGGEYFVTDDACTHGPGSMSEGELYGDVIECNFHGGQFSVRTGEVVGPPCMVPIRTYNVSIAEGDILIEV
ncbi:MAG TPA: non-heme iron oxygenase ferredoxin subunit [Pseudolabrys sp.]|jgi:nitrite reductase/ring-hydroxylating ferredoxin subunit|nr:non-heme iron oxygenase ferredoxin subunit [Pseudolabrys sp.]